MMHRAQPENSGSTGASTGMDDSETSEKQIHDAWGFHSDASIAARRARAERRATKMLELGEQLSGAELKLWQNFLAQKASHQEMADQLNVDISQVEILECSILRNLARLSREF